MQTHITNCFCAPLEVKASLLYLQHRSLIQKAQLMGNWKITFFKRVWNRLHHHDWNDGSFVQEFNADISSPANASNGDLNEDEDVNALGLAEDIDAAENFDTEVASTNADELANMRDLIRAAALWLTEQDANAEARVRMGRGIGTIQTVRPRGGRGGGRGIRRRLSA
jgi:hypothetical protein